MSVAQGVRVWTRQIEASTGRVENLISAVARGVIEIDYVNWETAKVDLLAVRQAANELDVIAERITAADEKRIDE